MRSNVKSRLVRISPKVATKLLSKNERNRRVSQIAVDRYTRDMLNGEWACNGEPIIVGASGTLLDGQHRLYAVVKSGVTITAVLVEGVDDDAFSTIDSGKGRTFANVLGIDGEKNCAMLAGAVRLVWLYRNGYVTGDAATQKAPKPSHKELLAVFASEPGIAASVEFAAHKPWRKLIGTSLAAFCHFAFSEVDPEGAEAFMSALRSGEFPKRGKGPIKLLRDRLIDNLGSVEKLNRESIIYLVFRAWKAYHSNTRLKRLNLPRQVKRPAAPRIAA